MKLTTSLKKKAPRDSTRFIDKYLNEIIDYGGIPCTRAEAILDMQRMRLNQPCIDRWLQGYELASRMRQRREQISLDLYVDDASVND